MPITNLDEIEDLVRSSLPGPTEEIWPSHVREIVIGLVAHCRDAERAALQLARTIERELDGDEGIVREIVAGVGGVSRRGTDH